MRGLIRRAAVAAGAAVVLLGPAAGVAAQANGAPAGWPSAPVRGWSITPSPNPRAGNGALNSVSCPTTSVCTAVGLHVRASGLGVTLAERRSGGVWTVQPTPNPRGAAASALNGVSCPSGSACTAVGEFFAGSGAQLTLAERWNGRAWRIQSIPNPPGARHSLLAAVSCASPSSCTAVGGRDTSAGAGLTLAEQWNGRSWHITPTPNPAGSRFSFLNDVSCTAPSSCTAVGAKFDAVGNPLGTVAERWDGTSWVIQPTPDSAQAGAGLLGVACAGPSSCTAVGGLNAGGLAERWNGASWSLQAVPAPAGAQFAQLVSVSCAVSSCEAVGGYVDSSGAFVPLGERWNGRAWRVQSTPNPPQASGNGLSGVSCPSASDCTAVGLGNGAGTPVTLGERWRDGRWRLQAVPSPVGAAENQLNGIACPATNACEAVGTAGPTRGVMSTEALRWNGRTWRLQHIPTLPGGILNAVSCVTESDCIAVGGPGTGPLAERWNGVHWTVQPTPKPAGAQQAALNAIWCGAASSCMAAGGYIDATGKIHVLTERWNGHTWRVVPAPTPSSPPNSFFTGVACPASSACTGVGISVDASGNPTGTFAERWNGHTWTLQRTPTQHTPGGFLGSVWCQAATACIATGSTNAGTLAERLSGDHWSVLPTPNPPGTVGDFLGSVSCTSLSACTGAGLAFGAPGGFPPQTLAERWNGKRWRIQPTPILPAVHDMNGFSVACPARSACIAAGGFENDGPGSKTLTERWRATGAPTTQTAPAASSPRANGGIAGCIRAAIDEGFATGAAATRIEPMIKALMPQRSQPASEIERITALCSPA